MRLLYLFLRALVFLLLLGLAVKNDGIVTVQAFFGASWQLPLVVVMLATFVVGLLCGVGALSTRMFAQTRELARLRAVVTSAPRPTTSASVGSDATD